MATKIAYFSKILYQTGANLAVFEINIIDCMLLIDFVGMGKRLGNGDFSFLPMPVVSSVKDQSKLPKRLIGRSSVSG